MTMKATKSLGRTICGAALSAFVLSAAGCAGGTSGTGLHYGVTRPTPSRQAPNAVTYATLQGTVMDSKGNPLPNVTVTAETTRLSDRAVSDEYGVFVLEVSAGAGETVDFVFSSRGKNWKHSLLDLPAGQDSVFVNFRLDGKGAVQSKIE
jgi:hypothetical protein